MSQVAQEENAETRLPETEEERPRRRFRRWLVSGLVVLVLAGAGVALYLVNPFAAKGTASAGVQDNAYPTATTQVEEKSLSSQTPVSGTLGYASTYTIIAPSGTGAQEVTQAEQAVIQDQQVLTADRQAESDATKIDNQVISVAKANVNAARSSSSRSQAEQQLSAARLAATRDHNQNQAKVLSDQTKLAGDKAALASLRATAVNPGTTYTSLPSVGQVIGPGDVLYEVDHKPVVLMLGSAPAYRTLYEGLTGPDVKELNAALVTLGYATTSQLDPASDSFGSSSTQALKNLQAHFGLPATGTLPLGQAVFLPTPARVTAIAPALGGPAQPGAAILTATSLTREVVVELDAAQQSEVKKGDQVTITLPDNTTTPGLVSSVGTVATSPSGGQGNQGNPTPTITVTITPTDPAATGQLDQAPVQVLITTASVENALVVPVNALLSLADGGYAVEVVGTDGVHRLVPVSLGITDDSEGLVQVSGEGISAGQTVVVPGT